MAQRTRLTAPFCLSRSQVHAALLLLLLLLQFLFAHFTSIHLPYPLSIYIPP
jgi:hypothetical protein